MQHTPRPRDAFAFPESNAGIGLQVDGSTFHGSDIHIGNHNINIGAVHGNVQLSNAPSVVHPETVRIPLASWISSLDFSQHQAEAFERRTEGTFDWLLDSPQMTNWKTEESGGILLCIGKPGAGKTTFASLVIHNLLQQTDTVVCYIFCRYHTTFTILQLFELILKQLILQCPSANIETLQKLKDKGLRPSLNEIVSILQANFDQTSSIFIVIDAVDECFTEEVRHRLLSILRSMTSVKILITSRPIPSIESALHGIIMLTICPNTFDISIHIRIRALLKPNLAKLIAKVPWTDLETQIVRQADGIFLLAELHISSLSEQTNLNAFLGALEALPKEASATYAKALERITRQPENVQQLAFYALSWVFHAFRPLTVIELQHGIAISRLSRIANEDDLDDEASIISACAGLLIVNQDTKSVSFIHYTVQEYIEQVSSELLPKAEVTKSCLRVVSIPGVQYHPPTHPLIRYAAFFWALFVRQHEDDTAIMDIALTHLSNPGCVTLLETALYHFHTGIVNERCGGNALHLVAEEGLTRLATILLERNDLDVNQPDTHGCTPLGLAAFNGRLKIVQMLLERNVDVDARPDADYPRTALQSAAERGHHDVVKALIATNKVDLNAKDGFGQTTLFWVAGSGNFELVELLLGYPGVDVDTSTDSGSSPLLFASEYGHIEVVKLLLDTQKVQVDRRDKRGRTPLSLAAQYGHYDVVKVLTATNKVELNTKDTFNQTALYWVAGSGNSELVKLLLGYPGVDVDAPANSGSSPLLFASEYGHTEVVKLLLGTQKVQVDRKDKSGRTPLSLAAQYGHSGVVKLFLDIADVDVNSTDLQYGSTPLLWAAVHGQLDVVKLLHVAENVNIRAQNTFGQSVLSAAANNGFVAVVQWLLVNGEKDDIDRPDGSGRTPLASALANGHTAVVKCLLGTQKVDRNAKDNDNKTLLWDAAFGGQVEAVESLLGDGENINCADKYAHTPLAAAAYKGNSAAVKTLLETQKVDTEAKDTDGRTALWWAASGGHLEAMKAILEYSQSDIDQPDNNGCTPLAIAAVHGHSTVVAHLLGTNKVNQNAKDNWDGSPFWLAAQNGQLEVLKLLMENGGNDTDWPDNAGVTPLAIAAANGHSTIVKYLLGTGKVNRTTVDNEGRSPLWWAASAGNLEALNLLMVDNDHNFNHGDNHGCAPLTAAARNGCSAVVEALLGRQEVDMDTKDLEVRTPFWWAAFGGHLRVMKLLIKTAKVDINTKDSHFHTPLICAVTRGHSHVVQFLLEQPTVDVHASDSEGWTAVLYAADSGHINILELFLDDSRITDNLRLHKFRPIKQSSFVTPILIPSPSPVSFDSESSSPMSLVSDTLGTQFQERAPNTPPSPSTNLAETQLIGDPPKPLKISRTTVFSLIVIISSFALLLALILQNT